MPGRRRHAALRGVTKRYGGVPAVDDLSLEIAAARFFSVLGPSGCGKTTTLRLLGGFVVADEGEVFLEGRDVTRVPPYQRPVNTVFQSYALFPHMSVEQNVAFGLEMKHVLRSEIGPRVQEALEMVRLAGYRSRRPRQLSGGQQQRVALARALVDHPEVLLLDEPLGALDQKLRKEMQLELKGLQRLGITFIFVTHDQEEALTMSDRIAVMDGGRIEQRARRRDLRATRQPLRRRVHRHRRHRRRAQVTAAGIAAGGQVVVPAGSNDGSPAAGDVTVSIRPEKVLLGAAVADRCVRLQGTVADVVYLGASTQVFVEPRAAPASRPSRSTQAAPVTASPRRATASTSAGIRRTCGWCPPRRRERHEHADAHPPPRVDARTGRAAVLAVAHGRGAR